jgi:putative peptidoglycan lipid II flippase
MIDPELGEITEPVPVAAGVLRRPSSGGLGPSFPVPGAMVGGQYRLIALWGAEQYLQFWQGAEIATGRLVGLSLIDVEGVLPIEGVNEVLARTVRLRGLDVCGVAQILNVLHTGEFGVVVPLGSPAAVCARSRTPRPARQRWRRRWSR